MWEKWKDKKFNHMSPHFTFLSFWEEVKRKISTKKVRSDIFDSSCFIITFLSIIFVSLSILWEHISKKYTLFFLFYLSLPIKHKYFLFFSLSLFISKHTKKKYFLFSSFLSPFSFSFPSSRYKQIQCKRKRIRNKWKVKSESPKIFL